MSELRKLIYVLDDGTRGTFLLKPGVGSASLNFNRDFARDPFAAGAYQPVGSIKLEAHIFAEVESGTIRSPKK